MAGVRRSEGNEKKAVFFLIAGLLLTMVHDCAALSLTVNEEECLYENVDYEGDTVLGNFVVVDQDSFWRSESPGIDFIVTAPGGNVVLDLKGSTGQKFEFRAPRRGIHKFCFRNSYAVPETVSFYIHVGHIPHEHNLAKDEHLDPINVRIAKLREALESASAEQKYLKARDARHRYMTSISWACSGCLVSKKLPGSRETDEVEGVNIDEETTYAKDEHGMEDCKRRKSSTIYYPLLKRRWTDL